MHTFDWIFSNILVLMRTLPIFRNLTQPNTEQQETEDEEKARRRERKKRSADKERATKKERARKRDFMRDIAVMAQGRNSILFNSLISGFTKG